MEMCLAEQYGVLHGYKSIIILFIKCSDSESQMITVSKGPPKYQNFLSIADSPNFKLNK